MRTSRLPLLVVLLHLLLFHPAHSQVDADAGAGGAVDGAAGRSGESAAPEQGPQDRAAQERSGDRVAQDQPYDPLERLNDDIFKFNLDFDRLLLKPVAETWGEALPLSVQTSVHNVVSNLDVVKKVVNNTLQGRPVAASREVIRFLLNSTVGVAGIFDMASKLGLEPSEQDMGITLGVYGFGHGPYLVLPLLPVTTVRDGVGTAADALMNPLGYLTPFYVPLAVRGVDTVNSRALNRENYEELALSIDPYGAARNAYLQVREQKLKEARAAGP